MFSYSFGNGKRLFRKAAAVYRRTGTELNSAKELPRGWARFDAWAEMKAPPASQAPPSASAGRAAVTSTLQVREQRPAGEPEATAGAAGARAHQGARLLSFQGGSARY